jgi:tetrahydromethanopterin S-methyltransferase subunit F
MFYAVEQAKPDSSSSSGIIVGVVAAVLGVGVIVVIAFFLR